MIKTVQVHVLVCGLLLCGAVSLSYGHNGLAVGHSPPAPSANGQLCPSDFAFQLFVLPDPLVGGALVPGTNQPDVAGMPTGLSHVAISAALARPEFGGYVYSGGIPGFHFVDAMNGCHAMTTMFTGGSPFVVRLGRSYWPRGAHMGMVDEFGAALLTVDGASAVFGDQNGAHFHPVWLLRRAGVHVGEFHVTSDYFDPSEKFTLSFEASSCWGAAAVDLSGVFNADVVDSGAGEALTTFDGAGRYWLLNGAYGTAQGLPVDGVLDVFQLGGPGGAGLLGGNMNVLFDNGVQTTAGVIDLTAQDRDGGYESAEMLVGAAGVFSSASQLVVRMTYTSGPVQVVTLRRAAVGPRFFPLHDWHIQPGSVPELAIGRAGSAAGFVRSHGAGPDMASSPPDSYYFQRVTFPLDPARTLQSISVDDFAGSGRVGVFAVSLIQTVVPDSDVDGDEVVGLADATVLGTCLGGPLDERRELDCAVLDGECDGDVDLRDWALFQNEFGM